MSGDVRGGVVFVCCLLCDFLAVRGSVREKAPLAIYMCVCDKNTPLLEEDVSHAASPVAMVQLRRFRNVAAR